MKSIDFSQIRPIRGSQNIGFEELCTQLARNECPEGWKYERKGTPDAGIECCVISPDGSEWGWQAKYFDRLRETEWKQLDESVNVALDNHPHLIRYYICIPYDRPDSPSPKRRSAMQKWHEHVEKWSRKALELGMSVEFIYWGESELLDRLTRQENAGRRRFWFDTCVMDDQWFKNQLEISIAAAGPRYTPEIHVDLPIAQDFETFGRTEQFFEKIKSQASTLGQELRSLNFHLADIPSELKRTTQ